MVLRDIIVQRLCVIQVETFSPPCRLGYVPLAGDVIAGLHLL